MPWTHKQQVVLVTVQCANCGKDFERPDSEIALKRACGQHTFFCGRECYQAHAKTQRKAHPQRIATQSW